MTDDCERRSYEKKVCGNCTVCGGTVKYDSLWQQQDAGHFRVCGEKG